jgi:hypothetical protein
MGGDLNRVAGELPVGAPHGILSTAFDQRVDQRIAIGGFDAG